MEIKHIHCDKSSYITFENIFDKRDLELIWEEVRFLCHENKLMDSEQTGSAKSFDGRLLKSNKGLWLDNIYSDRNISNYLSIYKKPFDIINSSSQELINVDINLKLFFNTKFDSTLMSYYENSDYYDSHSDLSCYTYVFWLFKEPKLFTGGDISFPELNQTINIKSNMAVLFPSWLDHKVDKIEMCDTIEKYQCNGRFAFSTFYSSNGAKG